MKQICILNGDVADPSILRDGDHYYLVCSTFCYFPGLLIYKSDDLLNWEKICYAVNQSFGDIWAPDLIKYKEKYYIYFPSKGTNWVVWSENIDSGWSKPIDLNVHGYIDPGHIADTDTGKRYLFFNNGYIAPLTDDGLSLDGELVKAHEAWQYPQDWETEGVCLEGPKLTYKNGWYYLTVAQGGTAGPATSHMVVSFRSKSLLGGWEASPYNPIVHTYSAGEEWWSSGHGTIFEDKTGKPYIIYHGYKNGNRNMGRQTLLCRAKWTEDGWFKSLDVDLELPEKNLNFEDNFDKDILKIDWSFYNEYESQRFTLDNKLLLKGAGNTLSDSCPMVINNRYEDYEISTLISVPLGGEGGLTLFYNKSCFIGICKNDSGIFSINRGNYVKVSDNLDDNIYLKIKKVNNAASYYFSLDGKTYTKAERSDDISCFEHNIFGGFLSMRPGIYATKEGIITFKWFKYIKL